MKEAVQLRISLVLIKTCTLHNLQNYTSGILLGYGPRTDIDITGEAGTHATPEDSQVGVSNQPNVTGLDLEKTHSGTARTCKRTTEMRTQTHTVLTKSKLK